MPTVLKSVLVQHSAARMFALVEDVERYPQFLPWCPSTTVFERTPEVTRARLDIDYHGLVSHISTLNRKRPDGMDLEFVDGPFERFHGHWRFQPLGEAGCRVEFALEYTFASASMNRLLVPVFGKIIETLVDRFVAEADCVDAPGAGR